MDNSPDNRTVPLSDGQQNRPPVRDDRADRRTVPMSDDSLSDFGCCKLIIIRIILIYKVVRKGKAF